MSRRGFLCGSEERSLFGIDEGVAASENAERRERLKARGSSAQTGAAKGERLGDDAVKPYGGAFDAPMGRSQTKADILAAKALIEKAKPFATNTEMPR